MRRFYVVLLAGCVVPGLRVAAHGQMSWGMSDEPFPTEQITAPPKMESHAARSYKTPSYAATESPANQDILAASHWEVGVAAGASYPMSHANFNQIAGVNYMGGVDFFYFPQSMIGVGLEADAFPFAKKRTNSIDYSALMTDFAAALKFVPLPDSAVQPYFIFAFGGNYYHEKATLHGTTLLSDYSLGGAVHAGAGLQFPVSEHFLLGLEAQWHHSMTDPAKFNADYLESASFLTRLSWKF